MSNEASVSRGVVQLLESLERSGVSHLSKRPKASSRAVAAAPAAPADSALPIPPAPSSAAPAAPLSAAANRTLAGLDILRQEVAGCWRCKEMCGRTQTVFGSGDANARLVFFGEAPGADEDRQGEPFIGRAGQLLTDIIEKGCKLPRRDVYIMNVLKCRPPGNRTPEPDEIENCRPFFERQLELLDPEFICCLGAVASRALLNLNAPMSRLRGRFYDYRGAQVICTYHPAYLLRQPSAKRDVWEDIQMLMRRMRGEDEGT